MVDHLTGVIKESLVLVEEENEKGVENILDLEEFRKTWKSKF